jgi:hypothetical protein
VAVSARFHRREQSMWRKLDRFEGIFPDEPSAPEPLVCLLYEDEADRRQMLSRVKKAGLGEIPRVMMRIESHSEEPVAALAGARGGRLARVSQA